MASLENLYSSRNLRPGFESNYGVDYVAHYKVPAQEKEEAEAGFVQLVETLVGVGLATEVRNGDANSILVFLKIASDKVLSDQVYRSRLSDWLNGARTVGPDQGLSQSLRNEPVSEAERLRLVYLLVTRPKNEGGAGITPGEGPWKHVESIFPLHDHSFNRSWIRKMSAKYTVDDDDLDGIRDKFGEGIAFYFAFMQSYFKFLLFPAAAGFSAYTLLGQFSWVYALVVCLWSVIFFEYWKKKEVDLAVRWGVRGASNIQHPRPQFSHERLDRDPVTGETVKVYSPLKRLRTQLLQIPFAAACIAVLGTLIATCNSLEIFISQVYNGPFKQYLVFIPTAILVVMTPAFSVVLTRFAEQLTEMENYETMDSHHAALVTKLFVLNFLTSYMALFFTAFVYIPFGYILTPYLEFWQTVATKLTPKDKAWATQEFVIDPTRISQQMFYFTVTAQIVNLGTETLLPYVQRKLLNKAKGVQSKIVTRKGNGSGGTDSHNNNNNNNKNEDPKEEKAFLDRVRGEVELEAYDVTDDYREMVIQFGYLSLFSVAWPLTACCFLVNNWVELRSDAVKIAVTSRRPIPWRGDSIGPWLDALGLLSWLGALTSAGIVTLCSGRSGGGNGNGNGGDVRAWVVLLNVFLAEHFYLATQMVVRYIMNKAESPGLQKERKERFLLKQRLLRENLQQDAEETTATPGIEKSEMITRAALEEEARQASIRGQGGADEMFWQRQRGMGETIQIGRKLIAADQRDGDRGWGCARKQVRDEWDGR